jgi:hypothetical protein
VKVMHLAEVLAATESSSTARRGEQA